MPKPLTIAVDVRYLRVAKTGTRTYMEELCKQFEKMNTGELRFYFFDSSFPVYSGNIKAFKWIEHLRHQLWKQFTLPLKSFFKKSDIVFCADDCVPLIHLRYKTIPVIHDAFCFEMPQNYGKLWLWLYLKIAIPAAKRSVFIITPTAYAKKRISHYTQIADDKLVVIAEGPKTLNIGVNENNAPTVLTAFSLTSGNYILHVGSMFKRKNIPALINSFAEIKKSGYSELKLVLAGPLPSNGTDNDQQAILNAIANNNLQGQVILTGYLPDADLSLLYSNALLYVFPSINEGFGIPILEAFKHDLPVLVANNTCLPEVGGDAVLQFDPYSVEDMVLKIRSVLDNEAVREDMITKGNERLTQFSWHQTALQLIEVFKKAI